uniref:Pentatricopeptide repeat-containing protein n=1 Tax=Kalanchoe fedtschenkoi TaxID=63787 RepID=A0A7N0UI10_KALFE
MICGGSKILRRLKLPPPFSLLPRHHQIAHSAASPPPPPDQPHRLPPRISHRDWLSPADVVRIFDDITDPHTIVTAFNAYSKRKDYKPTETLYLLLFTKLARARKFQLIDEMLQRIKLEKNCNLSDEFFCSVLKLYGNAGGLVDRVVQILYDMPDYQVWPSAKTFCFVLNLLVNRRRFSLVHQVYGAAPKLGVAADACCVNIMLKGLCESGSLDAALQVFDEFPRLGLSPNVRTFSTLMRALCDRDMVEEAFGLLDRMDTENVDPDAITFNILIAGLRRRGKAEECVEVLERMMKLKGCDPNPGSYQEVLYSLIDAKRFVEAKELMERMMLKGMSPSFQSFRKMLIGFCKHDSVDDACWALEGMVQQDFVPKMNMWRRVLRVMFPDDEIRESECLVRLIED